MIIDINAHLGHYPFRRLRNTAAPDLIALMDRSGVRISLVCSNHSLFYKDAHSGNEELAEAVAASADRLVPVATINPTYAGWEEDLETSIAEYGMKALRLAPSYHGYRLGDDAGRAALSAAARLRVPVILNQRIEDRRQRHLWDQAEDLAFRDVAQVAQDHPDLRFALLNWSGINPTAFRQAGLVGRCLIDFARMSVVPQRTVPRLIETIGLESMAYGSHVPFNYPGPALVKLAILELSERDRERVAWRNAAQFFRLET